MKGANKGKKAAPGALLANKVARSAGASEQTKLKATHSPTEHRPVQYSTNESPQLLQHAADYLLPELPALSRNVSIPQAPVVHQNAQPGQVLDMFTAAREMADNVRNTCMSLDSASRVVSSRIEALESVLDWADDLAQSSISQRLRLSHATDASFAAGIGVNGGVASASFSLSQQPGRCGTLHFTRDTSPEPAPELLQQAAATACIEAATACIEAVHSAGVSPAPAQEPPAAVYEVDTPTVTPAPLEETAVQPTPPSSVLEDTRPSVLAPDVELATALACSDSPNVQVMHPGVQGSSSVQVDVFEDKQLAMVTVRAAVHTTPCTDGSGDACVPIDQHVSMDIAAAFASSVAAQAAVSCSKEMLDFARPVVEGSSPTRDHELILRTLQHGNIVRVQERVHSQFSHESFIVELEHPETGHSCKAMIKPRAEGDFEGWHRTPIERVAYLLNLLLGLDLVPPTVYRNELAFDGMHFPGGGAVIFFVDNLQLLQHVPEPDWGIDKQRLLSDTRVLDVLLHNTDRHIGHFAWGNHWAAHKNLPVLIDHAAGFRDGACVCMEQENAFQTGEVTKVNSQTFLHLKLLDAAVIAKRLHGILSAGEIISMIERRDGILQYLNKLLLEEGIENVLL